MRFPTLLMVGALVVMSPAAITQSNPQLLQLGYAYSTFHTETQGVPVSMTFGPMGRLFVALQNGMIKVLEDLDGDRVAETETLFWPGTGLLNATEGIVWLNGKLFVSHRGGISSLEDTNNDLMADVKVDLVTGLPVGLHQNNDIFTDGTYLYFGLGSLTDHDPEPHPWSATLMRMNPDGTGLTVVGSGLRNIFDGVVHPVTGDIFCGDNGPNYIPGNPNPPEEINWVRNGLDYGHPQNWGIPPVSASTEPPVLELPSHTAPAGMAINPNTQISGYRNEMVMISFAALLGGVLRVPTVYGPITGLPGLWSEVFSTGFINAVDVAFGPAGEMYVADYSGAKIYQFYQPSNAVVTIEGPSTIGTTCPVTFTASENAGDFIIAVASLALGPPIPLSPLFGLEFNLDVTSPLFVWLNESQFVNFPSPGVLDASGTSSGTVDIPNIPILAGLEIYIQFVVLDGQNPSILMGISPPTKLRVNPAF